jgi:hypothetical protein
MKNKFLSLLCLLQICLSINCFGYYYEEEPNLYDKRLSLLDRYFAQYYPDDYDSSEDLFADDKGLYEYESDELNEDNFNDEESELFGSLKSGYKFVSGGAGEGKQHLKPNGILPNQQEIKTDLLLPAYCAPVNPCPNGYKGNDCDKRPYEHYTAEFSKKYQLKQNCLCDEDHNDCSNEGNTLNAEQINMILDTLKPNVNFILYLKNS